MNTLELILGGFCLFILGTVFGVTITCCAVMSGRGDKQLGIKGDEE